MAVKALEEARRRGHVRQGLLTRGRALSARWAEQNSWTRTPRFLLHSHSLQAQALAQGLEGDLLVLDLDWRPVGEDGSWEGQGKNAARRIGMRGCFEDRADVAPFGSLYSADSPGQSIEVSDLGTVSGRTVSDVDVDEVLGVESVNKALTRSHDGREEGEVRVLRKAV
ncbi:hypothetical protein POSPLADRAFT_1162489 [Postia placenta MAD-698-R-SB12]|uniref:Uncharacterized protein n=1 Tax=Postia placenta MAD-698-R-SB12 TaxID=670580 RepID=A0A1X6MHI8_9APHY|nr:hypothetical protein POSPLADRAFT_1162489 [Postia placenta MAD-698-R-SB12]OSX55891.1 hypothetical protein POSPLADRAFT_1162489 [Postia placenta MAD-698-R-SB12]